jgi:hypothetical protein
VSRKWKIVIGVLVALVVVAAIALPIMGVLVFRSRMHGEQGWAPRMHRWEPGQGVQPPERGVRPYAYGFGPGRGMVVMRHAFWPFRLLGGLACLAFFVVALGLAFAAGRHWRKVHPAAVPTPPTQ